MKYKAPRGVKDILPQDIIFWQEIEHNAYELLEGENFSEIRLPVFEKTELFTRGIGQHTDIVEKQMYTFKDKKGRDLSLRPEGTAGIIRAYLENKLYVSARETKLYYSGPMFRYERPQAGRMRQFYQIGAEIIGTDSPFADADILRILTKLFDTLGLNNLILYINSIGCKKCRKSFRAKLQEYLKGKINIICEDCNRRLESNPLRCLDCKIDKEIYNDAPVILDYICGKCKYHFESVGKLLDSWNISYTVDPHLVRGLDYYTRTAFEIKCDCLGAQNTVAAGGRYDDLVKEIGGPDIPAVGFSIGMERLVEVLKKRKYSGRKKNPVLYFAMLGDEARSIGRSIMPALVTICGRILYTYDDKNLKAHLQYANKMDIPYVLIFGEDEIKAKSIILKDMRNNSQEKLKLEDIEEYLKEHVKTKKDA